jgi:ATP diphosphatase
VFGEAHYANLDAQKQAWEELKAAERAAKGEAHDDSALAGISHGLPEWRRATKLQQRAASAGFDWPDHRPVLDKLAEEMDEVRAEFDAGADPARLEDEIGDVLFVAANLARHAGVDFSRALRHANAKFERRFRRMEQLAAEAGGTLADHDLPAQERLWQRAKQDEG